MSQPDVLNDQNRYRSLSREYSQTEPLVKAWQDWQSIFEQVEETSSMLEDADAEIKAMAKEEYELGLKQLESLERKLQLLLLPKDPNDDNNIFLEIRAGTGGDEAALFAAELSEMYRR